MSRWAVLSDEVGASAAELAVILPILIVLIFGAIDGGRWLWEYNRIEKATQMGVRFAAVTDPVAADVKSTYVGTICKGVTLSQGDTIDKDCFTLISCSMGSKTVGCSSGTADANAFNKIVARMQLFAGEIGAGNVTVEYIPSGLGFAGNPDGPDVSPVVRVSVNSLTFKPVSFLTFRQTGITMPAFRASLTAEDLSGNRSN